MRQLHEGDDVGGFVSERGQPQVVFLRDEAIRAHESDMSRTYVMPGEGDEPPIKGFYAICMGRVASTDLVENKGKKGVPPTPAALLAQLGKDDRMYKGFGQELLLNALERVADLAQEIGCAGMYLHAQVPELTKFYTDAGFIRIGASSQLTPTFWMSMKAIRAAVALNREEEEAETETGDGPS